MSSDKYLKKYLKYKSKFLHYKQMLNIQHGGAITEQQSDLCDPKNEEEKKILPEETKLFKDLQTNKKTYTESDEGKVVNKLDIVKVNINKYDTKPILLVVAGMSVESYQNTSTIVVRNIDKLKDKFKEIHFINCSFYKDLQTNACKTRDSELNNLSSEEKTKALCPIACQTWSHENKVNDQLATFIHTIMEKEENVHLLGKCNGAWVVSNILMKKDNEKYKGLYLGVPGIPHAVSNFINLSTEKLEDIKFVFWWNENDKYAFTWGQKSCDEKQRYEDMIKDITEKKGIKIKCDIKIQDIKVEIDDKDDEKQKTKKYHEIQDQMIDLIIKINS